MTLLRQLPSQRLLQLMEQKQLDGRDLHPKDRRNVVRTLRGEGWSIAKVAGALNCHESTIDRDLREI